MLAAAKKGVRRMSERSLLETLRLPTTIFAIINVSAKSIDRN